MTPNTNNANNKFEFLLTLEGNIICQRFFNVNNYNPESLKSMDLYHTMNDICGEISLNLKNRCALYQLENENFLFVNEEQDEVVDVEESYFILSLKVNEKAVNTRSFPAHTFHPKVRYTVDIRPMLRRLLNDLSETLSMKKLELV